MSLKFIDLFAGIGGMRLGLEASGHKCVFTSEWDPHAQQMYEANFGETPHGDITQIDASDIPDHDILAAGFPCQPFSISGHKKGFEDTRGTLFYDILRISQEKRPSILLLENVKFLRHHDKGHTLRVMIQHLMEIGYNVNWQVLNAKDFGLAQNRERVIIIATKDGLPEFDFSKLVKTSPQKISDILETEGEFEFLERDHYTILPSHLWRKQSSGLIFVGHRNRSLRKAGVRPGTEHLSRAHKQPNRIYHIDGTHPTLPSQETSGRFWIFDGEVVRKLTLRECYRLMGFPDDFTGSGTAGQQYLRIGNSIAIPMVRSIGEVLAKM